MDEQEFKNEGPRSEGPSREGRSLFWPILLIGVGVILLLANLGIIAPVNLVALLRIWPLLLIAAGAQILFGRSFPWVGTILSVLLAGGAIAVLVFAPQLNLAPSTDLITEEFVEALDGAGEASVRLDLDYGDANVVALNDSTNLLAATLTHNGTASLSASGGDRRTVELRLDELPGISFFNFWEDLEVKADVGLSPNVPMDLVVDSGSGIGNFDLSELQLTDVRIDNGSGSIDVHLPSGTYPISLDSGSGLVDVDIAQDAAVDLGVDVGSGRVSIVLADGVNGTIEVDLGSGIVTLDVPDGVGVEIRGSVGSGSVSVPGGFDSVGNNRWQSDNFDEAEMQLSIQIDVGSGVLRIR
ncbi:MAG: hypothetical protein DWQ07_04840 [Chloroflexi bacterium]|nr:MAG: hypothetical protein DWQ07_04840 [Chloroflexota bacterium]MBL1194758.1 hypothetical protein [Chloroflexota bacterium]NOH12050.1 hypothetical protein [Chloroflexota bacterium]